MEGVIQKIAGSDAKTSPAEACFDAEVCVLLQQPSRRGHQSKNLTFLVKFLLWSFLWNETREAGTGAKLLPAETRFEDSNCASLLATIPQSSTNTYYEKL
jgi:hypothetical protein